MTENKGAFINIRSDLKLKFTKFEAVPHPAIRPMVSNPFSTSSLPSSPPEAQLTHYRLTPKTQSCPLLCDDELVRPEI
jgi:hypothetical protein